MISSCACQICQQQIGSPVNIVPICQQLTVQAALATQMQGVEVLSICQVRAIACKRKAY